MTFDLNNQTNWFNGFEILSGDLDFDQSGREQQDMFRTNDFWNDGVVRDPNGLSNMLVTVDALTATLINVSQGIAYSNGYRISIPFDRGFNPNFLTQTTNGICTQASSGNKAVPLASYVSGQPNYVWAQYVSQISTARTAISLATGQLSYPYIYDGYGIFVTTNNPPGNPSGLTNAVYLATVYGQGPSVSLQGAPNGLTDLSKVYASIKPVMPAVGNTGSLVIGNGVVRGSSANSGGSQREILQGTISTPDLRDAAVISQKIDQTKTLVVNTTSGLFGVGTSSPVRQVDVVGAANQLRLASPSPSGEASVLFDATPFGTWQSGVDNTVNGGGWWVLEGGASGGYRLVLKPGGNFGIGNNTAAYVLDVSGDVNARTPGKLREGGIPLIPAGAIMSFYQASCPAGWTPTGGGEYFLRVVANATSGGTAQAFTSPSAGFNLQHSHTVNNHSHSIVNDGSHNHTLTKGGASSAGAANTVASNSAGAGGSLGAFAGGGGSTIYPVTDQTTTAGTHNHTGSTGNASPGTDNQLSTAYRFSYADVVLGIK